MFSAEYRDRITAVLVEVAEADADIVSAAFVGSSAVGGDRWSDLDLTFSVSKDTLVAAVLDRWTQRMKAEFQAVVLFDVSVQNTIYRVFLLPGVLQIDLSFAPEVEFGAYGPHFRLLFGSAIERERPTPFNADQSFGMAIHHVVRAQICIERARLWQAEYWIHHARDFALELACHRAGIEPAHGRGFDKLDMNALAQFAGALPMALTPLELKRALAVTTSALLNQGDGFSETVEPLRSMLAEINQPDLA